MSGSEQESTHRTIERVARESYGRLVAYLSSRTRDVGSAEDALGNALVAALETWPRDGVPQNPEAWLLTTPRRAFIDRLPHGQVAEASEPTLALLREESKDKTLSPEFPDERLKLLFVCAHPAIDPAMHTPLMLQTVLGLDAARIAHAFLISPTTMGQRLVRAKTKIRDGGIRFEIPQERELPQRLDAVLEAIYAAFGIGWDDMAGVDQRGRDLAEEAIWLARVLLGLMPKEAEVHGLLALMLHCEVRRAARRARGGKVQWNAIMMFYEELIRISPTLGTRTGYAAAVAEAKGAEAALAALNAIAPDDVSAYQPYWAVRAHVLQQLRKTPEGLDAFDRAIGLTEDPAVRQFLLQRRGYFFLFFLSKYPPPYPSSQ